MSDLRKDDTFSIKEESTGVSTHKNC